MIVLSLKKKRRKFVKCVTNKNNILKSILLFHGVHAYNYIPKINNNELNMKINNSIELNKCKELCVIHQHKRNKESERNEKKEKKNT